MQNDKDWLFGDWQALSGTLAGETLPEEIVLATRLTLSEARYLVNLAGTIDSGDCEIQVDASPIRMKIDGNDGPNAGRTFFAIVESINDGEFRIAYDLSGTDYPRTFAPTSAKSNYVATFKKC
ncbi:MAG: hypothetical protein AAGG48_29495 [Planctomycetota bacterium]